VFASAEDFDKMIEWAQRHENLYGNVFTYTLIDERAYNRRIRRRIIFGVGIGIGVVGIGIATYFLIKKYRK
jgi:hypothetical protein